MPPSRCEPPVPPKIPIPQAGPLPHMYVLADFDALDLDAEGLRLWQALRRVREWHADPPDGVTPRFDDPARTFGDVDPALRPSLAALDRLLRDPDPDGATLEAVAFACLGAALWAEERGAYRTALGFLHAAEDVDPDNPHYAYNVGRLARKLAFYGEAEAWLKWAHYVARTHRRWEVATLALSGLGNLHRQRGSLPRARRLHQAARRMARLRGLRTLEGDALYDLAVMTFYFDDAERAVKYAREALNAYGPGHSQVFHLAHDIAWYWMDTSGDFANAAHVFSALLEHVWKPPVRILVCANFARAAAGLGWKEVFERAWLEAWGAMRQSADQQGHAAALTQLALGAGNLGDWERAIIAAEASLKLARQRKEVPVVAVAHAIVSSLKGEVVSDAAIREVFRDLARIRRPDASASSFATELANAMRARRDGAPESPTRALVHSLD